MTAYICKAVLHGGSMVTELKENEKLCWSLMRINVLAIELDGYVGKIVKVLTVLMSADITIVSREPDFWILI